MLSLILTPVEAALMISNHRNRILSVTFTKRTDGTERKMTGIVHSIWPEKSLVSMREFKDGASQYRNVSVDAISSLRVKGQSYVVLGDAQDEREVA